VHQYETLETNVVVLSSPRQSPAALESQQKKDALKGLNGSITGPIRKKMCQV